jgi:hypothetical protein
VLEADHDARDKEGRPTPHRSHVSWVIRYWTPRSRKSGSSAERYKPTVHIYDVVCTSRGHFHAILKMYLLGVLLICKNIETNVSLVDCCTC